MRIEINNIHEFCKIYRINILKITLKQMSNLTGIKIPTISSFENGRSSNIKHLYTYYEISNEEQKEYFRNNIPYKFDVRGE